MGLGRRAAGEFSRGNQIRSLANRPENHPTPAGFRSPGGGSPEHSITGRPTKRDAVAPPCGINWPDLPRYRNNFELGQATPNSPRGLLN
jgi:hypothetical protein